MGDPFVLEEANRAGEWSCDVQAGGLTLCIALHHAGRLGVWPWYVTVKRTGAILASSPRAIADLPTTADAAKAEADAWLRKFAEGLMASLDEGAS